MTAPRSAPSTAAGGHRPQEAAPLVRRVGAQAAAEMRTVLRNGEQLVITLVLPLLILVALSRTSLVELDTGGADRIDVVLPGVFALAVMSTAFTSQAIATGFDRRNGVLRLLATTPLGRGGLVAGKVVAVVALELLQLAVLGGTAAALGWRPDPAGVPAALLALLLGTAAFTSLALLVAGLLRAEAVLAVANLVWVLLLAGGGVVLPVAMLPAPLAAVATVLPSGALGEALRTALADGGVAVGPLVVLAVWAAAVSGIVARTFRWS